MQKLQLENNNTITKIDDHTVKIYFHGVLYIISKDEIDHFVQSEQEFINVLYAAKQILQQNLYIPNCSYTSTALPNYDDYDTT